MSRHFHGDPPCKGLSTVMKGGVPWLNTSCCCMRFSEMREQMSVREGRIHSSDSWTVLLIRLQGNISTQGEAHLVGSPIWSFLRVPLIEPGSWNAFPSSRSLSLLTLGSEQYRASILGPWPTRNLQFISEEENEFMWDLMCQLPSISSDLLAHCVENSEAEFQAQQEKWWHDGVCPGEGPEAYILYICHPSSTYNIYVYVHQSVNSEVTGKTLKLSLYYTLFLEWIMSHT